MGSSTSARYRVRLEDGIIRFEGQLDFETAPEVWQMRDQLLAGEGDRSVDLAGLDHCDSGGLALLINLHGEFLRRKRQLRLTRVPAQLMDLARVSGVDGILPFAPDA